MAELDPTESITHIMREMVKLVRDAEKIGALAVVFVFRFHDAQPFILEDPDELFASIPFLMVSGAQGDLLKQFLSQGMDSVRIRIHRRDEVMPKIARAAKEAGASSLIVIQHPDRGGEEGVEAGSCSYMSALKSQEELQQFPCVMVESKEGNAVWQMIRDAEMAHPGIRAKFVLQDTPAYVYACGYGENGRLGIGEPEDFPDRFAVGFDMNMEIHYSVVESPQLVQALCGKATKISCGYDHTLALCNSGDVWSWGRGLGGRLGLGDEEDRYTPTRIFSLQPYRVLHISGGETHSIAVTEPMTESQLKETRIAKKKINRYSP